MGNVVELNNIIKKAISEFGKNIITEVRFVNILSDYGAFELCPSYKFVIKELIHAGFMRKLLDDIKVDKEPEIIKFDLLYQIQRTIPIQDQVLLDVLETLIQCLRYNNSNTMPSTAPDNQSKADRNNTSSQKISTNVPARAGKHWTAQEEKKLERLYYKNYTIHQMADELQRSLGSICGRLTSVLGYDNWSTIDTVIDERGYHVCIDIETKQEDTSLSPTIQSSQPSRKGKHWTKAEEEKLQRLYNQGNNVTDIAKQLGRTPLSVCGRLTNIIGDKWTTNDTRIDERGYHVLIDYLHL